MKVQICSGARCMYYGASNLYDQITELKESLTEMPGVRPDASFDIELIPCDDSCKGDKKNISPIAIVNGERMECATSTRLMERILNGLQEVE